MKYFCINEQTAYYLQKYIQYRKRKIFFGHGTIVDLVDVIRKNRNEKFLIPVSDVHKEQIVDFLDELQIKGFCKTSGATAALVVVASPSQVPVALHSGVISPR